LSPLPGSSGPTKGFYYTGPITDQPNQANFTVYQGSNLAGRLADYTFIHSTSGGAQAVPLAVGNYGFQGSVGSPFGHAFIYNPSTGKQIDIVYPPSSGDLTHTAYGIWYNPDGTYTIAGGVGLANQPQSDYVYGEPLPLGKAYLMDYNPNLAQPFSNYQEYVYSPKGADKQSFRGKDIITHFEGIWRDPKTGNYRLPATATYTASNGAPSLELARAKTVSVSRNKNGKFNAHGVWNDVPVAGGSLVTNDSISGDNSIGFVLYPAVTSASGTSISPAIPSTYVINPIKRR
jgi:hypothetical protein